MSRINETRQILWHETWKCVCILSVDVRKYGTMKNVDANAEKT